MWILVRRCGELCVSHVRSPDYSRCKATEEQASPVAANDPVDATYVLLAKNGLLATNLTVFTATS
jgi:hypothetical protein